MYNKLDKKRVLNVNSLIAGRRDLYHIDDDQEDLNLEHPDFDLQKIIPMLTEYAAFIGKPGQWLLPTELNIIAHVFDITIYYYDRTQKGRDPLETYNPDSPNSVRVYFNGVNHYERMEEIVSS